ncbi:hypothetical protein PV05_10099 [Exophiala xenobiotica]|uniref:SHSP domain-containing protein n=1 Tax=Exophiala xenobiotica TaxID=348802 RepID=A0A0D2EU77_9EURO|nr:uncharacterized protein PV05_10099 [Exophiala xenobiotica]KIW51369.1 hypothetical protein PV05_10099 [Exophiala xenobiotica]
MVTRGICHPLNKSHTANISQQQQNQLETDKRYQTSALNHSLFVPCSTFANRRVIESRHSGSLAMATLECFLHPHHISLVDRHSLRAKLQHVGDAYYNVDALPSHHGVLAPKFDVFEIDSSGEGGSESSAVPESVTGWLLMGDVPGVRPEDVKIEWIDEKIIFIRGKVQGSTALNLDSLEAFQGIEIAHLKPLHRERQEGSFERSVTFPEKVKVKNVDIAVQDGLVLVKVLRET